jgi:hypothetical protein
MTQSDIRADLEAKMRDMERGTFGPAPSDPDGGVVACISQSAATLLEHVR